MCAFAHTGDAASSTVVTAHMPVAHSPAAITQPTPQQLVLSGHWCAQSIGALAARLPLLHVGRTTPVVADAAQIESLDSSGAWMLQTLLLRLQNEGAVPTLQGLRAEFTPLFDAVARHRKEAGEPSGHGVKTRAQPGMLAGVGLATLQWGKLAVEALGFVGECALALAGWIARPSRIRWRPILFNIRSAGVDALPIVAVLSFLLGIVVAYQAADQLRQFGANIFVADLVGLSMLREFAPLITAIIIAGRSGSSYAAQIGTMAVTEEIDAMRTLAIPPLEVLVLPKVLALVVALPLLTVFADVLGVFGGMVMAQAQLGVGFADFLERFVKAVSVTSYLVGVAKAPVFAAIIAMVGCFQGLRTRGGADSVGRQTTRSVVQAIFLVIVADALFSVAFSVLEL